VKPHGGLYTLSARQPAIARVVAAAVRACDPRLILFGLAGSASIGAAREAGLRVAQEVFADRNYRSDGSLTPRAAANALVESTERAVAQALASVRAGTVTAEDGTVVAVTADTLCLHGDGRHVVDFAQTLHGALRAAGIGISRFEPC